MPSSWNWTFWIAALPVGLAAIDTLEPDTVAPSLGAVMPTPVGTGGGALLTVMLTGAEVTVVPVASVATAVRTCGPSLTVVLSQLIA